MKRLTLLLLTTLVSLSFADAGYLGSISSGPLTLPAVGEHPSIAMTAEEVIIELYPPEVSLREEGWEWEENRATITAQFLFDNNGPAAEVMMYMPVGITTVFSPSFPTGAYNDELLDRYRVWTEDGELPLRRAFIGRYKPELKQDLSWEEYSLLVEPLFPEEPEPGEPFYFQTIQLPEGTPLPEGFETWDPLHYAKTTVIFWSVSFNKDESQLVYYREECYPSSDYDMQAKQLTYPLFTGAGWDAPIGWGRVAVVVSEQSLWEQMFFYTGVAMPPPTWQEDFTEVNLSTPDYIGRVHDRALVWEFEDFEPVVSKANWYTFYPELGDMGTYLLYMDVVHGPFEEGAEPPSQPWNSSYIKLAWGASRTSYFVVPFEGLPLYDKSEGEEIETVAFGSTSLKVEEIANGWAAVTVHDYDAETDSKGWIELYPLDDDGLVKPTILPLL